MLSPTAVAYVNKLKYSCPEDAGKSKQTHSIYISKNRCYDILKSEFTIREIGVIKLFVISDVTDISLGSCINENNPITSILIFSKKNSVGRQENIQTLLLVFLIRLIYKFNKYQNWFLWHGLHSEESIFEWPIFRFCTRCWII